jgi:hypothetical protein
MTKEIVLTNGNFAIVDDDLFEDLARFSWYETSNGYAARTISYGRKKHVVEFMHRVVNDTPFGFITHHKNTNKLDNRKENLTTCNSSQNQHAVKIVTRNRSGKKGVYFDKKNSAWRSAIRINGSRKYLGTFATPEEAEIAYIEVSNKYYGEFCNV